MRDVYNKLVGDNIKRPAALSMWVIELGEEKAGRLWKHCNLKYNHLEWKDLDFRIRHNVIYSKSVLHKIDKEVDKVCAVCKQEDETLMHLFFNCIELRKMYELLGNIFHRKWGTKVKWKDWKWVYFVVLNKEQSESHADVHLMNILICAAKYATWLRRNLALFEKKIVNVITIFKNILEVYKKTLSYYLEDEIFKNFH